jgi:hypothetical protein
VGSVMHLSLLTKAIFSRMPASRDVGSFFGILSLTLCLLQQNRRKGKIKKDRFFVVNVFSKFLEEWELHNPANNPRLKILARIKDKIPVGANKSDNQNGQLNIG